MQHFSPTLPFCDRSCTHWPVCAGARRGAWAPAHALASAGSESVLPADPKPSPSPSRRRARAAACLISAALLAGALSACGSSPSEGTSAFPATVTPAGADLLASALVRPSGAERTAALSVGQALSHRRNPYLSLLAALETPGSPKLSYSREVAGWLGRRAGLFVTSAGSAARVAELLGKALLGQGGTRSFPFSRAGAHGAIVMDTSSASAARSFLDAQAARAGAHPASYRGVACQSTPGGVSFAIVKRFAVIGSTAAVHAVIDTSLGAPSLTSQTAYARLRGAAPAGTLAQVYLGAAGAAGPGALAQAGPLGGVLGLLGQVSSTQVTLVPSAHSLELDADALGTPPGGIAADLFAPGGQAAMALSELPSDSWLALGLGNAADGLGSEARALRALAGALTPSAAQSGAGTTGTLDLASLLGPLLEPLELLGADTASARSRYQRWLGSAAVFASGAGLLELKGGVVISSRDASLSRRAVSALAQELHRAGAAVARGSIPGTEASETVRLSGLPLSIAIAAGRNRAGEARFVIGLGEASVAAALDPPATLAGSASRSAAVAALGEGIEPVLILHVPTLLGLLESLGLTEEQTLLGALHSVTSVVAGRTKLNGEVHRLRVVASLQ